MTSDPDALQMPRDQERSGTRDTLQCLDVVMKGALLIIGLALCGCAAAEGPAETSPRPAPVPRVTPAPREHQLCVEPVGEELLDLCRAGGVISARAPLHHEAAEALRIRAERAWQQQHWSECAELFTELSEAHPVRAVRAEASYSAILCFTNHQQEAASSPEAEEAVGTQTTGGGTRRHSREEEERAELERWSPRQLTPQEVSMEVAYARNLCLAPESDDAVVIKYRRARLFYTANQWHVAAMLFLDIVDRHQGDELAPYAANLYLDCLNVIAMIDPERQAACHAQLAAEVERFLGNEVLMRDEELRFTLLGLQRSILWRRAESLMAEERFRDAAQLFLRVTSDCRETGDLIGSHDCCEGLYDAAISYEAEHCISAALEVWQRLIAKCGGRSGHAGLDDVASPWAKRAVLKLGRSHHTLGEHEEAARAYEHFAEEFPGEQEAPEALRVAIGLRLALDQGDEALADAQLFEKVYGGRSELKRATASAVFTAGEAYSIKGAWIESARASESFLRRYGAVARPDEVIRAHVRLGTARLQQGEALRSKALEPMQRAIALAGGDGGDALSRYRKMVSGADIDELDRSLTEARLVALVDAVARARESLGVEAPERALIHQLGMSLDRAVKVLTFVEPPGKGTPPLEQCEVSF